MSSSDETVVGSVLGSAPKAVFFAGITLGLTLGGGAATAVLGTAQTPAEISVELKHIKEDLRELKTALQQATPVAARVSLIEAEAERNRETSRQIRLEIKDHEARLRALESGRGR